MDFCSQERRLGRRSWPRALGLLLAVWSTPLAAQPVEIRHDDVSCVVAGQYPEIDACFDPVEQLVSARVFFRAAGTQDWYYVDMAEDASCFRGILPRPSDAIEHVDYYVAATDRAYLETRTAEYAPQVVERESECDGTVAPYVGTASVVVEAVTSSAAPAGFVGSAPLLGLSTATIAGVGAGVAGVAGGAAVLTGGGGRAGRPRPLHL